MPAHACDICVSQQTCASGHCGSCSDDMRLAVEDGLIRINCRRAKAGAPPLDEADLRLLIMDRSSLV